MALPNWLARALKAALPRGLLGRSLLIVLVPLVVVQLVALQVFYGTHMSIVSRRLSAAIAGEVALVLDGLERYPQDRERIFAQVRERLELPMRVLAGPLEPQHGRPPALELLERSLVVALEERFAVLLPEVLLGLDAAAFADLAASVFRPRPPPEGPGLEHLHQHEVSVAEHAELLAARLAELGVASFADLTADCVAPIEIVARFLAVLDSTATPRSSSTSPSRSGS